MGASDDILMVFVEEMETDALFRRIFDFGTTAASGFPRRSPAKRLSVSEYHIMFTFLLDDTDG